jgi:N-acyl homoserine lactone hydrolase
MGVDFPISLTLFDYGSFRVHEDGRTIPIPGYLVRSRAGRVVLIDTGFPSRYVADAQIAAAEDGLDSFGALTRIGVDNTPRGQLALVGLSPADITDLVLTHSDIDHIGSVADFTGVPIHVGRAERALERPRYFGDVRPLAWPDARYVLVDQETDVLPGLTAIPTPGHSPGHLSLLVRLDRTGPVLLAGDAISRRAELASGDNGGAWDHALARESAARLVELTRREGALLVYGHDPDQWSGLRKAPLHYG